MTSPFVSGRGAVRFSVVFSSLLLGGCALAPTPMDSQQAVADIESALKATYEGQEPVSRAIDLPEAMARAVHYNLDHRVQMLEAALRAREVDSASIAMLPSLVAGAGLAGRSNVDASSSQSLATGLTSLETSTSQDRWIRTRDLALSWNVLDFGLSYLRAKQAADRQLIAEEQRRKMLTRIIEEVRTAYWRALAAENMQRGMAGLQKRVKSAVEMSEQLVTGGQAGPLAALTYQRDLYELSDRINQVNAEVVAARAELAGLMNLPPGSRFTLVRPASVTMGQVATSSPVALVRTALENRPEMRAVLYDQRIASLDGTAALLEILPGINLNGGPNYTSNSFTFNNDWWSLGARASLNLMKLATYPIRQRQAEAQEELLEGKVKATAAAIALQVHVSGIRYRQALQRAETLSNFSAVQQRILKQMSASAGAEKTGEIELVREELTALLARARRDIAIADAQSAYAALQTTLGRDPYPLVHTATMQELAAAFRGNGGRSGPGRS